MQMFIPEKIYRNNKYQFNKLLAVSSVRTVAQIQAEAVFIDCLLTYKKNVLLHQLKCKRTISTYDNSYSRNKKEQK